MNPVTKQLDIDVYDPDGNLVDVSDMEHWIEFIIGRMRRKNPEAVQIPGTYIFDKPRHIFMEITSLKFLLENCSIGQSKCEHSQ